MGSGAAGVFRTGWFRRRDFFPPALAAGAAPDLREPPLSDLFIRVG
jgi:hypothetical protein